MVLLPCGLMAFLSLYPVWGWLSGNMVGFPIVETFALVHIPSYLMPFLEGRDDIFEYPAPVPFKTALAVCAFLLSVLVAHRMLYTSARFHGLNWAFLHRSLPSAREPAIAWSMLGAWWLFVVLSNLGLLPDFKGYFQQVRQMAMTAGLLALFLLFLHFGRRELSKNQRVFLIGWLATGVAMQFTSGYLVEGVSVLLLCLLAYVMGGRRLPVLACVVCSILVSFLHAGKAEMRERDRSDNQTYGLSRPFEIASFWCHVSWRKWFGESLPEEESSESLLERVVWPACWHWW